MARRKSDDWILQIDAQLQRLSSEIAPAGPKLARQKGWVPRVDVIEGGLHLILRIELAGVSLSRIVLNYNPSRNTILVRGDRQDNLASEHTCLSAHQLEIEYGEFGREIPLPDMNLDLGRTHTQFRDGILTVAIPKVVDSDATVVVEHTVTIRKLT